MNKMKREAVRVCSLKTGLPLRNLCKLQHFILWALDRKAT